MHPIFFQEPDLGIAFIMLCLILFLLLAERYKNTPNNALLLPKKARDLDEARVIVSLTTLPERLSHDFFRIVIMYLTNQVQRLEGVILINLPSYSRRDGVRYEIPDWIWHHPYVHTRKCADWGPLTKVMGAAYRVPDMATVIVVDDNVIYREFMVQALVDSVRYDTSAVHAFGTHRMKQQSHVARNGPTGYNTPDGPTGYNAPDGPTGYAAMGYVFKRLVNAPTVDGCFYTDDLWFGWALHRLEIPLKLVPHVPWSPVVVGVELPSDYQKPEKVDRALVEMNCREDLSKIKPIKIN